MRDSARNRLSRTSPLRSFILILLLMICAAGLIFLDANGKLAPLRNQAQSVLAPAFGALQGLGDQMGGVGRGLTDVQQLRGRVDDLEKQVSSLQDEHIQNQALKLENEQLRKQLKIEQESPWKLLSVDVVSVTPDVGRHTILISKGSEDKVTVGMALIGQEGGSPTSLVGIVDQVYPRSARVLLISDYSSLVSVKVYHQGTVTDGIAQGQFQRGAWLQLEEVDRLFPLQADDQVVTAGLTAQMNLDLPNAAIPRNIPIGLVQRVWTEGSRQYAEIRPYLNPDQVRYAWVILSHDD